MSNLWAKIKQILFTVFAPVWLVIGNEHGWVTAGLDIASQSKDIDTESAESRTGKQQIQMPIPGADESYLQSLFTHLFVPRKEGQLIPSGDFRQKTRGDISYDEWKLLQKSSLGEIPFTGETGGGTRTFYKIGADGTVWEYTAKAKKTYNPNKHPEKRIGKGGWDYILPASPPADARYARVDDSARANQIMRLGYESWQGAGSPGDVFVTEGTVEETVTPPMFDIPGLMRDYTTGVAGAADKYKTTSQQLADDWRAFGEHYAGIEGGLLRDLTGAKTQYEQNIAGIPKLNLGLPGGGAIPLAPKSHTEMYGKQHDTLLGNLLGAGQIAEAGAATQATGLTGRQSLMQQLYGTTIDALVRGLLPVEMARDLLSGFQAERLAQPTTLTWEDITGKKRVDEDTWGMGFGVGGGGGAGSVGG